MSVLKFSIITLLLISFTAPFSPVHAAPCDNLTGAALTRCLNAQAAAPTLQRFNPNVNLNSGNTYGGASISGVGGAIASCTNAGAFLVNTASSLLSSTKVYQKAQQFLSDFAEEDTGVPVSDEIAQDKLESMDKTSKCLDGIAYAVAKNTLAQVTNKTLNWVNTGLNGNPLYVQNMDSYLRTIANQQIRSFLQTAQGSDPIFGNALQSTIRHSITGQTDGLLNVQMDTPEARQYNSFLSDFTNGGWNSFLNPSNNPLGALFTATDTLNRNISNSQENAKAEVQRNNGFLDMKHCVQYADIDTSTTSAAIRNGLSTDPTCLQWVTDTPGSIIASQVQAITTSPIRQLEYADNINEVLGGFFDSFVNNMLSKGLRGSGTAGSSINFGFSSQGDNIVLDANGNPLDLTGGSSLGYQSTTGGNALGQNFDISRPQQFTAILEAQYNYLNRAKDSQIALRRVVPTVGALDYCIPGPNPTWQSNASGNFSNFVSSLQQQSEDGPNALERIVGAIPVVGGLFSAIFGGGGPPQNWSTQGIINDPVTGLGVQIPRLFYNTSTKFDGGQATLTDGLNGAYQTLVARYNYYTPTLIANAFKAAATGDADPSYHLYFIREAQTETASLINYNRAASEIANQYDINIGQTESNIDQMIVIRKQINEIVARAKTRYVQERAKAGNPVDMQCLDNAYQINNRDVVPTVGRQESDISDPIVQHSARSAEHFYNDIVK